MTRRRIAAIGVAVLTAYLVAGVLAFVAPGHVLAPTDVAIRRVLAATARLPHDVLRLNPGFVRAALIAMLVAAVPVSMTGIVGRDRRSRALAISAAALSVAVMIAAARTGGADIVDRLITLVIATGSGYALGALISTALCALGDAKDAHGTLRATGGSRRLAIAVTALYAAAVAVIAFHPTPVDRSSHGTIVTVLASLHSVGIPQWIDYGSVEFCANVLFFVPLGLLLVLLGGGRSWWVATAVGFSASCVIEIAQDLFLPARFASFDDVLSNTAGACIGALSGVVVLADAARRRERVALGMSTPTDTAA